MDSTLAMLAERHGRFEGWQVEIRDDEGDEHVVLRGEVETVAVRFVDATVYVRWFAERSSEGAWHRAYGRSLEYDFEVCEPAYDGDEVVISATKVEHIRFIPPERCDLRLTDIFDERETELQLPLALPVGRSSEPPSD